MRTRGQREAMIGMTTVRGDTTVGEQGRHENTRDAAAQERHASDTTVNRQAEALHQHRPSTYVGQHRK